MSLELRVAQNALRDGCSAKEVALMIVAGSEVVKQIHDRQGKKEAMKYTAHITQIAMKPHTSLFKGSKKGAGIEIEN